MLPLPSSQVVKFCLRKTPSVNNERFEGLREVTQKVVTSIQGQISLTKVLPRLIEDPETTGGTLGGLRQLIMGNTNKINLIHCSKICT